LMNLAKTTGQNPDKAMHSNGNSAALYSRWLDGFRATGQDRKEI